MTELLKRGSLLPPYMAYPRFLLAMDISETAKLVYVLLLDRARLSMKNEGWEDESGHVFVNYTIESLAQAIGKSPMTVKDALRTLEDRRLIHRRKQGVGRPNRIFVRVPKAENCPAEGQKIHPAADGKLSASNNKSNINRNYDYAEGDSL